MRCKRASACVWQLFLYVRIVCFCNPKMCRHLNHHQRNQRMCNVEPKVCKESYIHIHTHLISNRASIRFQHCHSLSRFRVSCVHFFLSFSFALFSPFFVTNFGSKYAMRWELRKHVKLCMWYKSLVRIAYAFRWIGQRMASSSKQQKQQRRWHQKRLRRWIESKWKDDYECVCAWGWRKWVSGRRRRLKAYKTTHT